jgi:glycosyltransferase involved in cell wall biosynthesis
MTENPLVSIVINSYNQAAYLEKTILSVIKQKYERIEILLVDGGSTDGSLEIIERYQDRLDWWVSEKDHGQAEGINKGLMHANGELVAWLNSDDTYRAGTVAAAVNTWKDNPSAVIVYGDVVAINEKDTPIRRIPCGDYQLQDLMMFKVINQPAVFFARSTLAKSGLLSPDYHYLLDHHLWLRLARHGQMIHVPEIWASGRFHSESKNVASASRFGEEAFRLARWLETDPAYAEEYALINKKVRAGAHRINARYLLDGDQPVRAFSSYWKGLFLSPELILPEWHRMVYCLLAMLGLKKLKTLYLDLRRRLRPVNMDD